MDTGHVGMSHFVYSEAKNVLVLWIEACPLFGGYLVSFIQSVLYSECPLFRVSSIQSVLYSECPLFRVSPLFKVSFIQSVLYWRIHCSSLLGE